MWSMLRSQYQVWTVWQFSIFFSLSPAPSVVKSPGNTSSSSGSSEETAKQRVKVDDKSPTTNLQVRLADGSRSVLQSVTLISDIECVINQQSFIKLNYLICVMMCWYCKMLANVTNDYSSSVQLLRKIWKPMLY